MLKAYVKISMQSVKLAHPAMASYHQASQLMQTIASKLSMALQLGYSREDVVVSIRQFMHFLTNPDLSARILSKLSMLLQQPDKASIPQLMTWLETASATQSRSLSNEFLSSLSGDYWGSISWEEDKKKKALYYEKWFVILSSKGNKRRVAMRAKKLAEDCLEPGFKG